MGLIDKHRSSIYAVLVALLFATYNISFVANSIAIGLIITFYFIDYPKNIKNKTKTAFKTKFVWFGIAYVIAQCIGLIYSTNIDFGFKHVNLALPFLILPIVALSEKIVLKDYNKLLNFIKYIAVAEMLFFICYHILFVKAAYGLIVDFTINEISSTSQIYPSILFLIAVLIALFDLLKKKNVFINLVITLFLTYSILVLSSRVVILMLFVSIVSLMFFRYKSVSIYKKIALTLVSFLVLSGSIYNVPRIKKKIDVFYKTIDFDVDVILTKNSITRTKNSAEHRFLIYYIAVKAAVESFPLGYGTGDYQEALNKGYKDLNFKIGMEQNLNTHNQYLEEFLKSGVFGGIIFILLIGSLLRFVNYDNQLVLVLITLAVVGSFFDSLVSRQHGVVFIAFFIPFFYYQFEINNKNLNN